MSNSYLKTTGTAGTGTIASVTNAAVVGSSTLFTTEVAVGDLIREDGTPGVIGRVLSITDNTHLTLDADTLIVGAHGAFHIIKKSTAITGEDGISYALRPSVGYYAAADQKIAPALVPAPAVTPAEAATPAWASASTPAVAAAPTIHTAYAWMSGSISGTDTVTGDDGVVYICKVQTGGAHINDTYAPPMAINALIRAGLSLI